MSTHVVKKYGFVYWVLLLLLLLALLAPGASAQKPDAEHLYRIALKSRQFVPPQGIEPALVRELSTALAARQHVLLQFRTVPTVEQRAALAETGILLLDYVPAYAWFASVPTDLRTTDLDRALVRWMGQIAAQDRIAPALRAPLAGTAQERVELAVYFFSDVSGQEAIAVLKAQDAAIDAIEADWNRYIVRLAPSAIPSLARQDGVQWIAPAPPPKVRDNDGIRVRTNVDAVHSAPYGLTGSGVDLGIWDGGIVDSHSDFTGRLTQVETFASVDEHATHVAGTMAGDGRNSANRGGSAFQWKGMAPGADILSYYWDSPTTDHDGAINTYGIELSQNSWGYGIGDLLGNCWLFGDYDALAPDYDAIITGRYGARISVVFSAGNERNDGDCGMSSVPPYLNYANIGPPHTAKNAIIVGATNSNDDSMTTFSSWGPVDDGRLKPDVVAPGCESSGEGYVHSTLPGNTYGGPGWCGTSMSAPAVSGISALLIEQYRTTEGSDPLPSTIRALLIHTAVDMNQGSSAYYNPGPDFSSGYGRVDAQGAADAVRARQVREDQVADGGTDTYTLTVPVDTPALKVTLAWDDVPGTRNANPALVNNLDLVLVEPDGTTTHRPWVLDPANPTNHATRGVDSVNNVEQVLVSNPTPGTWEARVSGTLVPQGPQLYSLVHSASVDEQPADVGPVVYDGHVINDASGNGDGIANPGESIALTVTLRNDGSDPASDVQATLNTTDPNVSLILTDTVTLGDIAGGGTATHAAPLGFRVSPAAPDGAVLEFNLDITAGNGGPWSDDLAVTVQDEGVEDTVRVTISKAVEPATVSAGELLTYTVQRSLALSGTHTYAETLVDPIPDGTTYVAGSVVLNGLPAPAVYSSTLDSLHLEHGGVFTASTELTLTYQVSVDSVASEVLNVVTGTASVDGIALPAPYTATATATGGCAGPPAPGLFSPSDGAVICDPLPTFSWSSEFLAEGYRIQVDDDAGFGSPLIDETVVGSFTTFYSAPDPLPVGTYHWRVRSYDTICGEGAWSETWRFVVSSTTAAPVLLSPADGALTSDPTPSLRWEEVVGAESYLVQLDDDSGFGSPIVDETVATATYAPLSDLEAGLYYWRVRASGPCGTGAWSSVWSVTITPLHHIYLPLVLSNKS